MIFQDPMTSLNPVLTIGDQIVEAIKVHHPGLETTRARMRAVELLELVGVPSAERGSTSIRTSSREACVSAR